MIGIPSCVTQEEFYSKRSHIDTSGTAKADVMGRDPKCPNLIEASFYDTKPVN